jgi:hypothetical protein
MSTFKNISNWLKGNLLRLVHSICEVKLLDEVMAKDG